MTPLVTRDWTSRAWRSLAFCSHFPLSCADPGPALGTPPLATPRSCGRDHNKTRAQQVRGRGLPDSSQNKPRALPRTKAEHLLVTQSLGAMAWHPALWGWGSASERLSRGTAVRAATLLPPRAASVTASWLALSLPDTCVPGVHSCPSAVRSHLCGRPRARSYHESKHESSVAPKLLWASFPCTLHMIRYSGRCECSFNPGRAGNNP